MKIKIKTEYIKLSDLLKFASIVPSGAEAKYLILDSKVFVGGEVCLMRSKKIYPGMQVSCEYGGQKFDILVEI